jgi:phosphoglucosamine mutase
MLESALESGLAAAGVDVLLVGPLPTPAIAYLTRTLRADAGIVISASHNPYQDNGIKFFSGDGYKLPDAQEEAIEAWMDRPMTLSASERLGKARRVGEAAGRYVEFCKTTFPADLDLRGMRLVLDCAHGANYKVAPMIFGELGATLELLGVEPNGININDQVGSTHPEALRAAVLRTGADMGIAFDGDGDRLLLVDDQGELLDGDEILWLLARDMCQHGELSGVVGTVMTNLALEQALAGCGVPMVRAPVGDRYVLEAMRRHGYPLGGESSGHIITPANTTGDGILAALRILAILRRTGEALAALREGYRPFPQVLKSVRIAGAQSLLDQPLARQLIADAEDRLGGTGRLLVRPSGTEPLLRIMVEAASADMAADVAATLTTGLAKLALASAVLGPLN